MKKKYVANVYPVSMLAGALVISTIQLTALYSISHADSSFTFSATSLKPLSVGIFDEVLQNLDTNTLAILKLTSPRLCKTIQVYKAHCCNVIRARYAVENSLLPSGMDNGWLVTTEVHGNDGLQRTSSPTDSRQYFNHMEKYLGITSHIYTSTSAGPQHLVKSNYALNVPFRLRCFATFYTPTTFRSAVAVTPR